MLVYQRINGSCSMASQQVSLKIHGWAEALSLQGFPRPHCDPAGMFPLNHDWLVVDLHLWKIWKLLGMMTFPIYGKMLEMSKPPTSSSSNTDHEDSHSLTNQCAVEWCEHRIVRRTPDNFSNMAHKHTHTTLNRQFMPIPWWLKA